MNKRIAVVSGMAVALLAAGCATSNARTREADALKTRVDSLEGQVSALNQRLDEVAQNQTAVPEPPPAGTLPHGQQHNAARPVVKNKLSVRQVQRALTVAGFYKGAVDGKEGRKTKKAIRAFQKAHGLKADGVAGSATSEALARYLSEDKERK